jgi:hypothetical protein
MTERIARWESPRGKHWVELYQHTDGCFGYTGNQCGGNLGRITLEAAMNYMAERTAEGAYFFCSGKTAMVQVPVNPQVTLS